MIKQLSKYRDNSILNTDNFDKRRFESLLEMSKGLKKINNTAKKELYTFEPLLNDIWASLYKTKPELKDEISEELQTNRTFMERIMNDEKFQEYRSYTMLDELASGIATKNFGEQTYEWILQQKEENERLKELLEQIQQIQEQQKQNKKDKSNEQNDQGILNEQMQQAMSDLNQEIQNSLSGEDNGFQQAMNQAMSDAKDTTDKVNDLLGGSAGKNDPQLKKVPLKDKLQLAEILSKNRKLKEVAEWAGRFKAIARKKQKSKHDKAIDRNGVKLGNDIEQLLPSELAMYTHSLTKLDFLRRLVEGQTMQYDQKGKEELGKGPIVCCLDESGSMRGLETQSKGFVLALMMIAKKQKRDFCFIPFSSQVGKVTEYERGKINIQDMIELANNFMKGGTNFIQPLSKSLEVINKSRFKQADIIFITDGEARVSEEFLNRFNSVKDEKDFNVLSLVISERPGSIKNVNLFSDKVVEITDFEDKKSFEAFDI